MLHPGESEGFKAGVHLGLFGFALACGLYNLMAWGERRSPHLLSNVMVYGAVTAYELAQIQRHLSGRRGS